MPMSMPERNDERVALFPIETALADLRRAFAAKHMIDHRARVSVRLRLIVGREKLDRALSAAIGGAHSVAMPILVMSSWRRVSRTPTITW